MGLVDVVVKDPCADVEQRFQVSSGECPDDQSGHIVIDTTYEHIGFFDCLSRYRVFNAFGDRSDGWQVRAIFEVLGDCLNLEIAHICLLDTIHRVEVVELNSVWVDQCEVLHAAFH